MAKKIFIIEIEYPDGISKRVMNQFIRLLLKSKPNTILKAKVKPIKDMYDYCQKFLDYGEI